MVQRINPAACGLTPKRLRGSMPGSNSGIFDKTRKPVPAYQSLDRGKGGRKQHLRFRLLCGYRAVRKRAEFGLTHAWRVW